MAINFLRNGWYALMLVAISPILTMEAQENTSRTSVSIKAQASVVEESGIEMVTIKNMDINAEMAVDGKIYVSALRDASAGVMLLKGRANAKFRITFPSILEIVNSTGKGILALQYEVNGYPSDNQGASEPIDAAERTLQIGPDGKYYLWVGGRIDINNARPGTYDGEFTIEIEYI